MIRESEVSPLKAGLPHPERTFEKLFSLVPKHIWLTLISACVFGLLVHLYMFTNKFPNHDDLGHMFGALYGEASGRWLLPVLTPLDGLFSTPMLIGTLGVLMLAISACFIVTALKIRSTLGCILTAVLMVSFPAVCATFTYMFSADTYFLSLALACCAPYFTNRYRFGFLGGGAAIVLSLGIYQSYFGFTAALMIGILILDVLDGGLTVKQVVFKGLKFVATLAAGIILYMLVVKLTTRETGLVEYMGISEMGKISISDLPRQIFSAYKEYYSFFIKDVCSAHFSWLKYALLLSGAATVFLTVWIAKKKKLGLGNVLLLAGLFVIFPLATNLIFIMAPSAPVHILMLFGLVLILIAPLAISQRFADLDLPEDKAGAHCLPRLCCWVIILSLTLTAYSYWIFSNQIYFKMDLSNKQAFSYSTRLLSAIEGSPGYTAELPVVLVGRPLSGEASSPTPELDAINVIGALDMKGLIDSYTYSLYLTRYLGAENKIFDTRSTLALSYAESDDVKAMPIYPASGSIAEINGYIVVRLGE